MIPDNALAALRLTTRAEHDRIEQILRLTEPMPLARQGAILLGFDAFLSTWEPRVHAALPARLQPWFRARQRGGFAGADVEWLRSAGHVDIAEPSARLAATLPLGDLAEVFGSLYVIEGSALGGRVIAPRLERTLGLAPGRGASHFHGFGGGTGAMWSEFRALAALEIGESPPGIERACQSARRTFEAMIACSPRSRRRKRLRTKAPQARRPISPPGPERLFGHASEMRTGSVRMR